MVRSFSMAALVVVSPITAISSARVNSDRSKDVTSGATTKSAGFTPTEFMLTPWTRVCRRITSIVEKKRLLIVDPLERMPAKSFSSFAVTLDADFLDPFDTPGVATPVRGGADYREAHLAMEMVADTGKMASFEITEINPILDVHNKTATVGMELVLSAFGKQIL